MLLDSQRTNTCSHRHHHGLHHRLLHWHHHWLLRLRRCQRLIHVSRHHYRLISGCRLLNGWRLLNGLLGTKKNTSHAIFVSKGKIWYEYLAWHGFFVVETPRTVIDGRVAPPQWLIEQKQVSICRNYTWLRKLHTVCFDSRAQGEGGTVQRKSRVTCLLRVYVLALLINGCFWTLQNVILRWKRF